MLSLSVEIDTNFFDILKNTKRQGTLSDWINYCKKNDVRNLENEVLYSHPAQKMESAHITKLDNIVKYLCDNLTASISHIHSFLPKIETDITHKLIVTLLPNGRINFGPKPSLQFFSIFPDAHPYETYLFLIHIYYHEISFINYTEYCQSCVDNPNHPEKLKYYILTLIQNEGIGNFAVYKELIEFKNENPNYTFKYFTYANDLEDDKKVSQSFSLLRQVLDNLNESNFEDYKRKINQILKNKQLPIINLSGTYIAKQIYKNYGLDKLINVYKRDVFEFFFNYFSTKDELSQILVNSQKNYFKEKLGSVNNFV